MTPVKQQYRHDPDNGVFGDCHRAALATVLDLDIEDVPHFADGNPGDDVFQARVRDFLAIHGLRCIDQIYQAELSDILHSISRINGPDLVYLLGGASRNGTHHTVICQGGKIVWDPAMDESGIVGPCHDGYYWITMFSPISLSRGPDAIGPAVERIARAAGDLYWYVGKGKLRPDEPLYAATINSHEADAEPIVLREGDTIGEVVAAVELAMAARQVAA